MLRALFALMTAIVLVCGAAAADMADPSPAIYVAQATSNSVVGVKASTQTWSAQSGTVVQPVSSGSGVVVKDGGYILTNYHVIENCNVFEVLLPSGEYIEARLVGSDSTLDIAVLQAESEELVTCEVGTVADLLVGSTGKIRDTAIGNTCIPLHAQSDQQEDAALHNRRGFCRSACRMCMHRRQNRRG